jgi:hypothetical protein
MIFNVSILVTPSFSQEEKKKQQKNRQHVANSESALNIFYKISRR